MGEEAAQETSKKIFFPRNMLEYAPPSINIWRSNEFKPLELPETNGYVSF